ncbi:urea transporter [Paraburkholderia acidiphila]|uniref:Urea transporter n=1 Tax=Paraburkholderia acidiphila TaxID=2571747 RepID=A0A7Z2G791_9BURK|nr:urea transporter [Paraburkholderia acidiphila]QGZ56502.1 urea transporter [Paraburkholderia acidiphila]
MFARFSAASGRTADTAAGLALRALLRSLGQIVLQAHAGTGACLLAALALTDWRLALAAVLGAAAANVCALVAGHAETAIHEGLAGYNGALAALAAFTFVGDAGTAAALALIAGGASAWIAGPLNRWLTRARLGLYSVPCLIATWIWLPLHLGSEPVATTIAIAPLVPHASPLAAVVHAAAGVLSGLAQTTFASGAAAGLCVLAGLAWSSRRAAAYALGGAALASALELACGASPDAFDAGLAGFNGALAALAVCALGTRAAFCATMLAAALHLAAVRCGLPVLTAPFVLASWTVHLAARRLRGLRAASTPPEESEESTVR